MTQEDFRALGTKEHHGKKAEWGGRQWRLTWTYQGTGTCMLQPLEARRRNSIATGYEHVTLIKKQK